MKKVNAVRPKNENNFLRLLLSLKLAEYKIAAESFSEIVLFLVQYSFLFEDTEKILNSCDSEQSQLYTLQGDRGIGARYLDAKYSRWLSADPALNDYVGGTSFGEGGVFNYVNLNLYHYGGNNPIKYTDPDGKSILSDAVRERMAVWKHNHYNRNNGTDPIAPDLSSALAKVENGDAILMSDDLDDYHEQGTASDHNPRNNVKIVSSDGKIESVYNENGSIVTDPVNMGTNNKSDPNKNYVGHFIDDMLPYYLWGNTEDDPTTMLERITGSYQGDVNFTKEEAAADRANRAEIRTRERIQKALE